VWDGGLLRRIPQRPGIRCLGRAEKAWTGPAGRIRLRNYCLMQGDPSPRLPGGKSRSALSDSGRRRRGRPGRAAVALVLVLGLLVGGGAGALAYFTPVLAVAFQQTGRSLNRSPASPSPAATPGAGGSTPSPTAPPVAGAEASADSPFTVLLLGSDDDSKFASDHVLTQSMILVRVVPASHQVTMLSIPRDLWVPLAGGGEGKIDAAYADGGSQAAVATVEQNFGVHVDDYVWIGLKGLIQVIDRLGGVDVMTTNPVLDDFYPADVDSANPYDYERVAVLPGAQHLDGVHALQYVRSRHDDLRGDFGRSERQQQVLLALRARARTLNPADLPALAAALNGEFRTSIGLDRIQSLIALATAFNDPGAIHQVVLLPPYTSNGMVGDQDVVFADWSLILPLVHQSFP